MKSESSIMKSLGKALHAQSMPLMEPETLMRFSLFSLRKKRMRKKFLSSNMLRMLPLWVTSAYLMMMRRTNAEKALRKEGFGHFTDFRQPICPNGGIWCKNPDGSKYPQAGSTVVRVDFNGEIIPYAPEAWIEEREKWANEAQHWDWAEERGRKVEAAPPLNQRVHDAMKAHEAFREKRRTRRMARRASA